MKKITFLLIALLIATVGYSQLHLLDEEFTGNSLPAGWVNSTPSASNGTQLHAICTTKICDWRCRSVTDFSRYSL